MRHSGNRLETTMVVLNLGHWDLCLLFVSVCQRATSGTRCTFPDSCWRVLANCSLAVPSTTHQKGPGCSKISGTSKTKTTPLPSNFKKCWHVFTAAMLCPLTATKFYDERVRRSDSTSSRLQGLRAAEHLASHGPCLRWIMPGDVGASMEFSTCKITQKESICPPTNVWHQLPTYVCVCVCGQYVIS